MYTYGAPVQSAWASTSSYSIANPHHHSTYSSQQQGLPALPHLQPSHHQAHHTPQLQHSQLHHHNSAQHNQHHAPQQQQHHSPLYGARQHSMYSQPSSALNYTASQRSSQSPPQQPGYHQFMSHSGPIQPVPTTSGPPVGSGPGPGSMAMPLRPIASMAPHPSAQPTTEPPHQTMGPTAIPYRSFATYHSSMPPSLGGTGMAGMHHAGNSMSVIPNISIYTQGGPGSYGLAAHHTDRASQSQSERPFKCDQCTQSFSRNHDLKRHKRIHLAVKPFPCTFCAKSFSRKDALKRHRLVKGCENKVKNGTINSTLDGRTPHPPSDIKQPLV
ncbi:hypothetical protein CDD82_6169 [Ophiocordyceps australis]|uniref:C2H2-type domain-containing protein n=1 Tax=Ophiocordyceps australis TaxID=1399860 RepID=A0A2C5XH17_9HYPO|nr:hypothetical protein CDD82_6169 [Ophiocordyceps australis]